MTLTVHDQNFMSCGSGKRDDDFIIAAGCGNGPRINVQVVRVLTDAGFWKGLSRGDSRAELRLSVAEAAHAVAQAIWHKANPQGIPRHQRTNLILALDTIRLPALALPTVSSRVPQSEPVRGEELGFRAVHVVGPVRGLVHKLAL